MKKFLQIFITLLFTLGTMLLYEQRISDISDTKQLPQNPTPAATLQPQVSKTEAVSVSRTGYYQVFTDGEYIGGFGKYDDALALAEQYANTHISSQYGAKRVWDNYPPFIVYTTNTEHKAFYTFGEAAAYAKSHTRAFIYHRKDDNMIWTNADPLAEKKIISGITRIDQKPELPRGCEVTSLAMLLNYKGVIVSKLSLAERIDKNPVSISRSGGNIYCGDPNDGFIGDMYNINNFGLGVYHKPIAKLLAEFMPYSTVDLTGCEFEDLFYFLNMNRPVWVIINTKYRQLSAGDFQTWITPSGDKIEITYSEHSALVNGYDNEKIYFLDPLNDITSLDKGVFIAMWEQMGRQAVSVSN